MNRVSKTIVEAVVYSNVWISIGAISFTLSGSVLLEFDVSYQFLIFIFSTTLFTYNFQRLVKFHDSTEQQISGPRADWIKKNLILVYTLTIISMVVGVISGWIFFKLYYWLFIIIGFFSFFYVWKLPGLKANIRSLPAIKIFVLSSTWVIATQIVPFLIFSTLPWTSNISLIFIGSFLFVISISIPFDIRDVEIDSKKLKTIPQITGVNKSRWLGVLILVISGLLMMTCGQKLYYGLAINAILTGVLILKSGLNRNELYYSGLVDGTLICQFLFLNYIG